ncbi:hypothetical protein ACP70R_015747 [Stipagrostis hirtigluma subsp. patula]
MGGYIEHTKPIHQHVEAQDLRGRQSMVADSERLPRPAGVGVRPLGRYGGGARTCGETAQGVHAEPLPEEGVAGPPHAHAEFTGLKDLRADMPKAVQLEDGDEVTEEILQATLRRALGWMSALQAEDGHWPGDFGGIMYLLPFWIFALHITGSIDAVLSKEHKSEICRHIYNHQNEDGGWSFNILDESAMFGSCLNYVTLRLLGEVQKDENDGRTRGCRRTRMRRHWQRSGPQA